MITLETELSFEQQQRIAAEAYTLAARLAAAVGRLMDCDPIRESSTSLQRRDLEHDAQRLRDQLLEIAGEMVDSEGRTAFEVLAQGGGLDS